MNREEAIKHLETYSTTNGSGQTTQAQHEEAKRMGIKALEQMPVTTTAGEGGVIYYPQVEGVTPTVVDAGKQEPSGDAVDRKLVCAFIGGLISDDRERKKGLEYIRHMPPVTPQPKTGHCKDCKWWKDSDGTYCRGIHAESKCPINRKEVYEGNGYCYMFEPQESEDKDADKKCTYKETGCGSCKRQLDCPIEADKSERTDA